MRSNRQVTTSNHFKSVCLYFNWFNFYCSGKTKLIDTFCTLSNRHCNVDTIDDSVTGSFQQIDLNRHLEEIAQSTEALMVQQVQNCALIKSFNADTINLLNSWEMFVALNSQHNGKHNVPYK